MSGSWMQVSGKKHKLQALVVLCGEPDTGKSTTLNELGRMLINDTVSYYEERGQNISWDRRFVIRYWKWFVGIGTAGDDLDHIKANLKFFNKQRCDIGILAARPGLLAFCEKECKSRKVRMSVLEKPNGKTDFGQIVYATQCAESICGALAEHSAKKLVAKINVINQDVGGVK